MDILATLSTNPALASGDRTVLARVAEESELREYAKRGVVARLGSPVVHVLMVASGRVELHGRNRATKAHVLVSTLSSPALIGDAEVLSGTPWITGAKAAAPTAVVAIPRRAFEWLVTRDAGVARALYRDACARQALLMHVIQILALQGTSQKVLRLVWRSAERLCSGRAERSTQVSVSKLARALALNPRTIRRALQQLETDGHIRRTGSTVEFVQPKELPRWPELPSRALGAAWELS
ncbi:MAG: Crp/Fnr family transcriptional regulator [Deltaproteobacteria bacterium]|nr:Crp/Fnr family transcriptional regulator [Deltaproteobacteria bacterium]